MAADEGDRKVIEKRPSWVYPNATPVSGRLFCGVDSSVAALCDRYVTVIHDDRCGFDDVVSEALSLVRSWPGSHAVGRAVRRESSLHPL